VNLFRRKDVLPGRREWAQGAPACTTYPSAYGLRQAGDCSHTQDAMRNLLMVRRPGKPRALRLGLLGRVWTRAMKVSTSHLDREALSQWLLDLKS
jgi:hypothetical protein